MTNRATARYWPRTDTVMRDRTARFWYNMIKWSQPSATCFRIVDAQQPVEQHGGEVHGLCCQKRDEPFGHSIATEFVRLRSSVQPIGENPCNECTQANGEKVNFGRHSCTPSVWESCSLGAGTRVAGKPPPPEARPPAGMCPMWWDNGGSYKILDRTTGAITQPTIVSGIVTGAQKGLATPNTYATLANP